MSTKIMDDSMDLFKTTLKLVKTWKYTGLPAFKLGVLSPNTKKIIPARNNWIRLFLRMAAFVVSISIFCLYPFWVSMDNNIEMYSILIQLSMIYLENMAHSFICLSRQKRIASLLDGFMKNSKTIRDLAQKPLPTKKVAKSALKYVLVQFGLLLICSVVDGAKTQFETDMTVPFIYLVCAYYFGLFLILQVEYFIFGSLSYLEMLYTGLAECVQISKESDVSDEYLEQCKKIYSNLQELSKLFEETMGEFFVMRLLSGLILSGTGLFFFYEGLHMMLHSFSLRYAITVILSTFCWEIILSRPAVTIAATLDGICQKADNIIILLSESVQNDKSQQSRKTDLFNMNCAFHPLKFSAMGLFSLRCEMIHMMIGGIATHLVYTIQFYKMEKSS